MFLARELNSNKLVALKIMFLKKYAENNILDQLKQEIEVAAFASLSRRFTPIWSTTASLVCTDPSSTWIGVLLLQ